MDPVAQGFLYRRETWYVTLRREHRPLLQNGSTQESVSSVEKGAKRRMTKIT
jgi:hypothetical protein